MRLRGRFTLWFGLAAVIPIAVAALITREVVARSYRGEHDRTRNAAEQAVRREISRLSTAVGDTVLALASRDDPFVGGLLQDLRKDGGQLVRDTARRLKEPCAGCEKGHHPVSGEGHPQPQVAGRSAWRRFRAAVRRHEMASQAARGEP